jgi:hypothetical protein
MKKIVLVTMLVGIGMAVTGCKVSDKVKTVIENSYSVVVECEKAVDVITEKLTGSELWTEVGKYIESLDKALDAVETTLKKVAPMVGANLTTLSSASAIEDTTYLDAATEKLLKSIE